MVFLREHPSSVPRLPGSPALLGQEPAVQFRVQKAFGKKEA